MAKKPPTPPPSGGPPGPSGPGGKPDRDITVLIKTVEPKWGMAVPSSTEADLLRDIRHSLTLKQDVGYAVFANFCKLRALQSQDGQPPKTAAVMKLDKDGNFVTAFNFDLLNRVSHLARMELLKFQMLRIAYGHFSSRALSLRTRFGPKIVDRAQQMVLSQVVNSALLAEEGLILPVPEMYEFPRNLSTEQYCTLLEEKGMDGGKPLVLKIPKGDKGFAEIGKRLGKMTPEEQAEFQALLEGLTDEQGFLRSDTSMEELASGDQSSASMDSATKQLLNQVNSALESKGNSLKSQGFMRGEAAELIEQLNRPPRVGWQAYSRRMRAKVLGDWKQPTNKRLSRRSPVTLFPKDRFGIHYRGTRAKEQPSVLVVVDTSGSMGARDIAGIRAELTAMLNLGLLVDIMQVDAAVAHPPIRFERRDKLDEWFGRGGTDFRPAFTAVKDFRLQPAYLIYFTDGMGTAPEEPPPFPVLWVLTSSGYTPSQFRQSVCEWGECTVLDVSENGVKDD